MMDPTVAIARRQLERVQDLAWTMIARERNALARTDGITDEAREYCHCFLSEISCALSSLEPLDALVGAAVPPQPLNLRVLALAAEDSARQHHVMHGGHPATFDLCVEPLCWLVRKALGSPPVDPGVVRPVPAQE
jgi:hypothetical protein